MAGIGFQLRKLMQKGSLAGMFQAYLHAILISSGPWIFTVIALGCFYLFSKNMALAEATESFRVIIIYNFAFSLVLSAPIMMITTRYLADCIYKENLDDAPGLLLGALILLSFIMLPIASTFYLLYTKLSVAVGLVAIVNFMLITWIWQVTVFISALRYYTAITLSFLVGMIFSVFAAVYLSQHSSVVGMLAGFNIGLSVILSSLIALIFAEYPNCVKNLFAFLKYFTKYWELALGGMITTWPFG